MVLPQAWKVGQWIKRLIDINGDYVMEKFEYSVLYPTNLSEASELAFAHAFRLTFLLGTKFTKCSVLGFRRCCFFTRLIKDKVLMQ